MSVFNTLETLKTEVINLQADLNNAQEDRRMTKAENTRLLREAKANNYFNENQRLLQVERDLRSQLADLLNTDTVYHLRNEVSNWKTAAENRLTSLNNAEKIITKLRNNLRTIRDTTDL